MDEQSRDTQKHQNITSCEDLCANAYTFPPSNQSQPAKNFNMAQCQTTHATAQSSQHGQAEMNSFYPNESLYSLTMTSMTAIQPYRNQVQSSQFTSSTCPMNAGQVMESFESFSTLHQPRNALQCIEQSNLTQFRAQSLPELTETNCDINQKHENPQYFQTISTHPSQTIGSSSSSGRTQNNSTHQLSTPFHHHRPHPAFIQDAHDALTFNQHDSLAEVPSEMEENTGSMENVQEKGGSYSDEIEMNECIAMEQENDSTAREKKLQFIEKIIQRTSELWEGADPSQDDDYLLELYSKIDKNNVNKNILSSFMKYVLQHGDIIVLESMDSKQKELYTIRKELKNFIRNKKYNNKMINSFFNSERYKQQFQYYLQIYAVDYFQKSKVLDQESHFICIAFFIRCFYKVNLRDHIVTYNKSKYFKSIHKPKKISPKHTKKQKARGEKDDEQDDDEEEDDEENNAELEQEDKKP